MRTTSLIKAALLSTALLGAAACDALPGAEESEETEQEEGGEERDD